MLQTLAASRYVRRIESGRTRPILLAGEDNAGGEREVVVKLDHRIDRRLNGLVAEALTAMLARDLGFFVPQPFLVRLDGDFLASVNDGEVAEELRKCCPVIFGSALLGGGFTAIPTDFQVPQPLHVDAAEIFALDIVTNNTDRRNGNPNCMSDGHNLAIFDHELALFFNTLFYKRPWEEGALLSWRDCDHIFWKHTKSGHYDYLRLATALSGITADKCDEYHKAIPEEWAPRSEGPLEMIGFIREMVARSEAVVTEVRRVLS